MMILLAVINVLVIITLVCEGIYIGYKCGYEKGRRAGRNYWRGTMHR